jgi:3-oxoacyl-(acyl-carrier-protein) synthase
MFVIERLSHALARRAKIYAEIRAGRMLSEAHHVTGLDADADALTHLIEITLDRAGLEPNDIGHVNAHGTGTAQNDLVEMRAIRKSFAQAHDDLCVTANKSSLGHLVNAAGSIELAMTVLAMRDGFAPPTLNLTNPDPECTFDATPLVGRKNRFQHALKLSVAFGGHLVAVALSRWNDAATGFGYPEEERRKAA